jgi:hypothetical protein
MNVLVKAQEHLVKRFAVVALLLSVGSITAHAYDFSERSPIVYNSMDDEVAVIKGTLSPHGAGKIVIQSAQMFVDLEYYIVVMPRETLRPREGGGWYTSVSNDQLPYLKPVTPTYFQPSGD